MGKTVRITEHQKSFHTNKLKTQKMMLGHFIKHNNVKFHQKSFTVKNTVNLLVYNKWRE